MKKRKTVAAIAAEGGSIAIAPSASMTAGAASAVVAAT